MISLTAIRCVNTYHNRLFSLRFSGTVLRSVMFRIFKTHILENKQDVHVRKTSQ